MRPALAILLAFLLSLSLAQTQPQNDTVTVGPGDVIGVLVYGHGTYSGDFTVLEDGSISGPGFGRLVVEGRTIAQIEEMVRQSLGKLLKDPKVDVYLRSQLFSTIYIFGATNSGAIRFQPGQTLRELVISSGLPGEPDLLQATLYRKSGEIVEVNLPLLLRGDAAQANPVLRPGDSLIILPRNYIRIAMNTPFAAEASTTGEQRLPAGVDVYQAVAQLNALANRGALLLEEMKIVVRRGTQVFEFPAKQDPRAEPFPLQSGDTVIVQGPDQMRVTVAGEVVEPGEFVVNADASITTLISRAGGPSGIGTRSNVVVLRGTEAYTVDLTSPQAGGPAREFPLRNNDIVYVRRNERKVYVLGFVKEPGSYLIPDNEEWHAADALARAGGLAENGTHRRVTLLRAGADGKYAVVKFHADEFLKDGKIEANPRLQPGDVLFFGQPRGMTISNISQIISSALLIDTLVGR